MTKRTRLLEVEEVKHLDNYRLKIKFSNGKVRNVDFASFLKKARNPAVRKYLSPKNFENYSIYFGQLNWNDFEMVFPLEDLYQGKVE